jgi:predicted lysophospholipase L1 biosynthesis ABC-type transport system permease subunit
MAHDISSTEASLALEAIQQRRRQVAASINVPGWYWPFLAGGWIGLGVLADFGPAWASTTATVLFGAAHATISPRAMSGRHPSSRVSIRHDLVDRQMPKAIILFLIGMTVLTVGIALLFNADGARHPATLASLVVAALVLTGGPGLMAWLRARAERRFG